ncbi:dTDP-4-dehydrorhamnose 3,5-epimerase [Faecalimonas hominis]
MAQIKVTETKLQGIKIIEPQRFGDNRGWFMEVYQYDTYRQAGINCSFVQDNRSYSKRNVLRGLHFQKKHQQDKLISVLCGKIFDVVVDIRKDSATFGQWLGIELSAENRKQLFIPKGFAHGYIVLSEDAEILYKCSEKYYPDEESGILWNDKDLQIDWQIEDKEKLILSEKDKKWQTWKEFSGR